MPSFNFEAFVFYITNLLINWQTFKPQSWDCGLPLQLIAYLQTHFSTFSKNHAALSFCDHLEAFWRALGLVQCIPAKPSG